MLKKEFPNVPILALTSSATNRCKVDTMRQLGLEECDFFTQSFNRPNLRFVLSEAPPGIIQTNWRNWR